MADVTDEEKKRRLAKLAAWKQKKALAENGESKTKEAATESAEASEQKRLDRLERLKEWKRKKQSSQSTPKISVTVGHGAKSVKPSRLLDLGSDEEDIPSSVPFKKPKTGTGTKYKRSVAVEEDELDKFMESLQDDADKMVVLDDESEEEEVETEDPDDLLKKRLQNLHNEKFLSSVDYSTAAPFRKDFYVEQPSVATMTEEDVEKLRQALDGIKVKGNNCPKPVADWNQMGLPSAVINLMLEKFDFKKPTAIQAQALPAIMSGRDVLGIAKTGSGKTLAFVLPLLRHVQDQPPLAKGDGPIAILLSPTRELAIQIHKQLAHFTKRLGISSACCCGGSSIEPQIAEMKRGAQVVVATPGRLIDLLAANNGRVCNLKRVTYVVLDEADRMFDFGFEPQVRKVFSQVRPQRQSVLFSATFTRKMESLATMVLQDPVQFIVGGVSVVAAEIKQRVEFFDEEGKKASEVAAEKFGRLVQILKFYPNVKQLVFVEKQESADTLLVQLLTQKVTSVVIHGGKDQIDRKDAIKIFSDMDSGVDVLIATSVAARGLDVKGLDVVINYDAPSHMEDYVHRVGRTGRAGRSGEAFTFVTSSQERQIADLVKALRLSKIAEDDIDERLRLIADAFLQRVQAGEEKFRFGFGGLGLSKLDEKRTSTKQLEQTIHTAARADTPGLPDPENGIDLPTFEVVKGKAPEGAGKQSAQFYTRVVINDLPAHARRFVMQTDGLSEITEATRTVINSKGQYYAPGAKVPKAFHGRGSKRAEVPGKLYFLVEGPTEAGVEEANKRLRARMLEGLEMAANDESTGPAGRYTV